MKFRYLGILWLLSSLVQAQVLWQKNFQIQNKQSISDVVSTEDCGLIFVGWWHYINATDFNRNLLIYKTNEKGDLLWSKKYTIGNNLNSGRSTDFKIFAVDQGASFIILGTSNAVLGQATDDDLFWLNINTDGNKLAQGSFSEDQTDYVIDRFVGAVQVRSDEIFWAQQRLSTDRSLSQTYLRKINAQGQLLQSTLIDDRVEIIYKSMIITKDQHVLIFGSSRQELDNGKSPWRLHVIKSSLDGTIKWKKYFGPNDHYNMAFDIEEKNNGDIYLIASTASISNNQLLNPSILIITIDQNGNELATCKTPHWLGGVYHPDHGEMDAMMLNDTLIIGTVTNDNFSSAVEDFSMYKIGEFCQIFSLDSFPNEGIDFLHAIKKIDADRFLLLGESFKNYSYNVPCYARAVFHGDSLRTCLTAITEEQDFRYRLVPNPANEEIYLLSNSTYLEHATLSLRDVTGKIIKTWCIVNGNQNQAFSIRDIPNGLYYYTIQSNHSNFITSKLEIHHN